MNRFILITLLAASALLASLPRTAHAGTQCYTIGFRTVCCYTTSGNNTICY